MMSDIRGALTYPAQYFVGDYCGDCCEVMVVVPQVKFISRHRKAAAMGDSVWWSVFQFYYWICGTMLVSCGSDLVLTA